MSDLDYHEQQRRNSETFSDAIKAVRPDVWALMDVIDKTNLNWTVLWQVAYSLHNLATDTKYGQIVIEVEDNTVRFVRGVHSKKINEPLIKGDVQEVSEEEKMLETIREKAYEEAVKAYKDLKNR